MKENTKLRMLPLNDYLRKIGRYDPKLHGVNTSSPGYPSYMMKELQEVAERGEKVIFIRDWEPVLKSSKRLYKHKKFITVKIESSGNSWTIPSNWVVRI